MSVLMVVMIVIFECRNEWNRLWLRIVVIWFWVFFDLFLF